MESASERGREGRRAVPPLWVRFSVDDLRDVRRLTRWWAARAGLPSGRAEDFVLAVNEIATNAVIYGSPQARLLLRITGAGAAEAEIRDGGTWQPAAGAASYNGQQGGMGLRLARQICDAVQIRAAGEGTTVIVRISPPWLQAAG